MLSSNSQYSVKKTKLGTDSIITRNFTQLPLDSLDWSAPIHHEGDVITNCQSVHAESKSRQAPNRLSADVQTPKAGRFWIQVYDRPFVVVLFSVNGTSDIAVKVSAYSTLITIPDSCGITRSIDAGYRLGWGRRVIGAGYLAGKLACTRGGRSSSGCNDGRYVIDDCNEISAHSYRRNRNEKRLTGRLITQFLLELRFRQRISQ